MSELMLLYGGFTLFVLFMLALDLGVFHRTAHRVSLREALTWSAVWIGLALAFNVALWLWKGPATGMEFLTGYVIEKSLSVDNVFVFAVVFAAFKVPDRHQHKVLFWGILGALALRAVMIAAGAAVLARLHWIIYVFGAVLVISGVKLLFARPDSKDPSKSLLVRAIRRILPFTDDYRDGRFWVREGGRFAFTPLFLVLAVVEFTDVVFAVDSIPAIFAVTSDPFIVYTSNIFAILGLRSLYFALAGIMDRFVHLRTGLAAILCFVGIKMALMDVVKIPIGVSLGVIVGILALAIGASQLRSRDQTPPSRREVVPTESQS